MTQFAARSVSVATVWQVGVGKESVAIAASMEHATNEVTPLLISGVQAQFDALAREWRHATRRESSMSKLVHHPAYQRIISLGWAVVPLILADLERAPDHWSFALAQITKEDPVPAGSMGDLRLTARAWLDWGAACGIAPWRST